VQNLLLSAFQTIRKLSDSLGMDYEEVNENFDNILNNIEDAMENVDTSVHSFSIGDKVVLTEQAIQSGLFSLGTKAGAIAKVVAVEGGGISGTMPTTLEILSNTSENKYQYRQWLNPVIVKKSSVNISNWFTKVEGE